MLELTEIIIELLKEIKPEISEKEEEIEITVISEIEDKIITIIEEEIITEIEEEIEEDLKEDLVLIKKNSDYLDWEITGWR